DEERLQRLLAGRGTAAQRASPPVVATAPHQDEGTVDGKDRTTSTIADLMPITTQPSYSPSHSSSPSPACHVDLNHLTESYPLVRKVLSEVRSVFLTPFGEMK